MDSKKKTTTKAKKDFTAIKKAVDDLGHLGSPYYLKKLGYTQREINAAVEAGALRYTREGDLRTV